MHHKGLLSFVFSVYTKKQIPLLAMNPKGPSSFVFSYYTKRQSHLLQWTPKDVTPLCPVITPRSKFHFLQWTPKDVTPLCPMIQPSRPSLENFYNQESVSWKAFCKNEGEEENRITQVFAQWTFLDKASVWTKTLRKMLRISMLKFVPWSHIYSHLMALDETMLNVVTFGNFFSKPVTLKNYDFWQFSSKPVTLKSCDSW